MSNDDILNYLQEIIPEPKCELNYNKDYELVIAVMLSAQTTDKRVNKVTKVLFQNYPNLDTLSKANLKDIITIVKELGNYNKKSQAIIDISKILLTNYKGIVPNKRKDLESLPMIGRKTASVILSVLFKIPNIAVDTHVNRVSKRLKLVKDEDDIMEVERHLKNTFPKDKWIILHHQLLLFGRYYCKSRNPKCINCKLKSICSYKK